jgi:hypothetical protein
MTLLRRFCNVLRLTFVLLPSVALSHTALVGHVSVRSVSVFNLSDPSAAIIPRVQVPTDLNGIQGIAIDPQGSKAVAIATSVCEAQVIDISQPTPAKGPKYACSNWSGITSVAVSGSRAVIVQQSGLGLQVLDISANTLSLRGTLQLPFTPGAVAASGDLAVVSELSGKRIAVVNIAGSAPVKTADLQLPLSSNTISAVAAYGSWAVIGEQGQHIIPINLVGTPTLGTPISIGVGATVSSVALVSTSARGVRALVAQSSVNRIVVVDLTDTSNPRIVLDRPSPFSGTSAAAAVVGMNWIGVVTQSSGPGVQVVKDLATNTPSLSALTSIGAGSTTSSVALTINPPDTSAGHGDPHLTTIDGTRYDFRNSPTQAVIDGHAVQTLTTWRSKPKATRQV